MKKLWFFFAVSFAFVSCSKDQDDVETNSLNDSDLLQINVLSNFADDADINYSSERAVEYDYSNVARTGDNCATVSIDNANYGEFPKTITVDFGQGCTINNITRKGTLTIVLTNYIYNTGSKMTITRGNDYYINGYKVEGTIVYENITTNAEIPAWTRDLTNGKITTPAGGIFTYTDSRSVQLIEGASTWTLTDNVYKVISGSRKVVRPNNTFLNAEVLTPLIKSFSCAHISEGTIQLEGTYLDGVLDYGNGSCDNIATYTHSNGCVYTISL